VSYSVYSATHYTHNPLHSTRALLIAKMMNMLLNGVFLVQLTAFCSSVLLAEPVFIRVIVFGFFIFDASQTGLHFAFHS
jgi:hypothetical protein